MKSDSHQYVLRLLHPMFQAYDNTPYQENHKKTRHVSQLWLHSASRKDGACSTLSLREKKTRKKASVVTAIQPPQTTTTATTLYMAGKCFVQKLGFEHFKTNEYFNYKIF